MNLGPPVNTAGAEVSAKIAPDGQHLYFAAVSGPRCGFYVSEWDGTSWSIPTRIPIPSPDCTVNEYPSITADGQLLYFDRYVTGTKKNVLVSVKTDSVWGTPINLLSQIGDSSWTPFITPSGDSLFFTSNRMVGGIGGGDIWVARRFLQGDLNLDGQHTITDIMLEFNKVFLNMPYPAPEKLGDMNCDSRFSPADVGLLLLTVFLSRPYFCSEGEFPLTSPALSSTLSLKKQEVSGV